MFPARTVPNSNNACRNALKLILLALFGLSSLGAWANGAAVVTHLSGMLVATQAEGASRALAVKSEVHPGETLTTQAKTYARLKFQDGAEIVLRPNSQMTVSQYAYQPEKADGDVAGFGLLKGGMRMVSGLIGKRNPDKVKVETAVATVGIRGTHFGLLMCQSDCTDIATISGRAPEDGLHIDVAEGAVAATNRAGEQAIGVGQFGYVRSVTTPPALVPTNQGIQVTMPQSISRNNSGGKTVGVSTRGSDCAVQ